MFIWVCIYFVKKNTGFLMMLNRGCKEFNVREQCWICFQAWQYAGRVVGFVCQEWMHCSSHATEPYGQTKRKKNETKSSDRQWDGCIGNEQRGLQQLTSEKHIGPRKLMHYACSLGEKRFLSQNFSLMLRACQVPLFFSAQNSHQQDQF